jgi:hypothetical protein
LFEKAHEAVQGETYLKNPKRTKIERRSPNGRLCEDAKNIGRSQTLNVCKELDIKLSGGSS